MKHVFSIFLLFFIFQNVLTEITANGRKMAKVAKLVRRLIDAKKKEENLRKLQNTDVVTDTEAGDNATETPTALPDTSVQTSLPTEEYKDETKVDEPESASATAKNAPVPADKPVAKKPKTKGNSNASVQVTKFHGFKAPQTRGPGVVTFGVYISFFGRPIVKFLVMRLRIAYSRLLRNLEEAGAESARTDCELDDRYIELVGKTLSEEESKNVNYNCKANATQGDASTANFTLNTDVPMTMVNANGTAETLDFAEVNFNGDAAEESTSLQTNNITISDSFTLKVADLTFDKQNLLFIGELSSGRRLRNLDLHEGERIQMTLVDNSNEGKKYDCFINGVSSSSSTLKCDTSRNPIRTTAEKLDFNAGTTTNNETLFNVKMTDKVPSDTQIITPGSNKYTYNKSSSGLSGGAIAGIVIACVVALAAASIAAIMLRKPTPPVDNTTIVDLKTETI